MIRLGLATATLGAAMAAALTMTPSDARAGEKEAQQACLYQFKRSGEQNTDHGFITHSHRAGGAWDIGIEDTVGMPWTCRARDDGFIEHLGRAAPGTGAAAASASDADDDDGGRWGEETRPARQACRQALRERNGRGGISVKDVEFSEANTLVVLKDDDDKSGTWRCLSSNKGKVAELSFHKN